MELEKDTGQSYSENYGNLFNFRIEAFEQEQI